MNLQKNASLIVGLAIPVLLAIAVVASIYIPRLTVTPPQHNFLYTSSDYYNSKYRYTVSQGKFVREEIVIDTSYREVPEKQSISEPTFFVYDVATKNSQELSFEEAEKLHLDANRESPDGYRFEQSYGNGLSDIFGGSNGTNWFLIGHNTSYKVELKQIGQYPSVQFFGWVIK